MHLKHIALLIAFAALTAFGCSPTQIGDRELTADELALNDVETYGKVKLKSAGENLDVTITIPPSNDVCHGTFKQTATESAYPVLNVIPGFATGPTTFYEGTFDGNLPAKCLSLLGAPGGTKMALYVQEPIMLGTDNLVICKAENMTGKSCLSESTAMYTVNDL